MEYYTHSNYNLKNIGLTRLSKNVRFHSRQNTRLKSASCVNINSLPPPFKTTWCVQVLRSPKEAFAAAMQSWRERCEKCVCLQSDYFEK